MDDPRDAELYHVNSRLSRGLKACRTIVSNYRALIAGGVEGDRAKPQPKSLEEER
jgi:hypothetical protein